MTGPNPVGIVGGDCFIRIAGVRDHHLLHVNDMPLTVKHTIEDAPRWAANARTRVIVEVNGRVVYSYTPLGLARWQHGISIQQRLRRRTLREAKARALAALQRAEEVS